MVRIGSFAVAVAIAWAAVLGPAPAPARAEEATVSLVSPVTGRGFYFETGVNRGQFLGALNGLVYVQSGSEALDGARIVCPVSFAFDSLSTNFTAEGSCALGHGDDDKVFAKWSCAGTLAKGCRGRFTVTGGTGRFRGITGESEAVMRTSMVEFADIPKEQRAGIGVVRSIGEGLIFLPGFRYRIP